MWGASSIALVLCSGCSDLKDIDAKTDRLLRDRVAKLGGGSVAPNRSYENPVEPAKDPSTTRLQPDSTNPGVEELRFDPASEARDAGARLTTLQDEPLDSARAFTLPDVFRQGQATAREYATAEEDYLLASIRLLIERHRFSPRLFADATTSFNQVNTDGSRELTQRLLVQAGVTQQLTSGGSLAARWVYDAAENLRNVATGRYVQSSRLVLDASIPLLRGAGDVAQETLVQAERDLVYAARSFEDFRRRFLVSLARDFFQLQQQQDGIKSQKYQLEALEKLEARQRAWYTAGRLREFEVNLATNQVLSARATLASLRETYILSLDRFKVRLGIPVRDPVVIENSDLILAEPKTTLEASTEAALAYRLDLQNLRDRVDDAKRQVANAGNAILPDLDLVGNVTFPTKASAREGGAVYEFDDIQYSAGATFRVPLDREIERLQLRQQTILLAQNKRGFDRFRDELILDVRGRTRELERARLTLNLAEERVKINLRRKEEQDLKPDEVTTQELVDTAQELLTAEQTRNQSRADLRNAVLDYLIATGQLRVQKDGSLESLPGMTAPVSEPNAVPVETK